MPRTYHRKNRHYSVAKGRRLAPSRTKKPQLYGNSRFSNFVSVCTLVLMLTTLVLDVITIIRTTDNKNE